MAKKRLELWKELLRQESGQDLIEYALLAGFVSVAVGATFPYIAEHVFTIFSRAKSVLENSHKAG